MDYRKFTTTITLIFTLVMGGFAFAQQPASAPVAVSCLQNTPSFTALPTLQEEQAGATLIYNLSIKNNDGGCSPRSFLITGQHQLVNGEIWDIHYYIYGADRYPEGDQRSNFTLSAQENVVVKMHITSKDSWPNGEYTHYIQLNYGSVGEEIALNYNLKQSVIYKISPGSGTPFIKVISPNGGEVWQAGQNYTILWTSQNLLSAAQNNISIVLRKTSDEYWSLVIRSGTINDGVEQWNIPPDLAPANDFKIDIHCVIFVGDVGLPCPFDQSDAPFTITGAGSTPTPTPIPSPTPIPTSEPTPTSVPVPIFTTQQCPQNCNCDSQGKVLYCEITPTPTLQPIQVQQPTPESVSIPQPTPQPQAIPKPTPTSAPVPLPTNVQWSTSVPIKVEVTAAETTISAPQQTTTKLPANCTREGNTVTCPTDKAKQIVFPVIVEAANSPVEVVTMQKRTDATIGITSRGETAITTEKVTVEGSRLFLGPTESAKPVSILPHEVPAIAMTSESITSIATIELKTDDQKPVYEVEGTREARFLFFIPVSVPMRTEINAMDGKIISVKKPWWSFFTF